MSSVDDFVNSVANADAHRHAVDFAYILSELDYDTKSFIIRIFVDSIDYDTKQILENEMDIVI
jgi:hypothetical protein